MVKYEEGKIYKIVCNKSGLIYVGSTTKHYLSDRLVQHRMRYKHYKDGKEKTKSSSYQIIENGDYDIILLENYPCKSKDELTSRERFYIDQIECVNIQKPGRTMKEWTNDNKEILKEYHKNYYQVNRDEALLKGKEYHILNKEKRNNYNKEYNDKNKEIRKEKINCEVCNKSICKDSLKRHHKLIHSSI